MAITLLFVNREKQNYYQLILWIGNGMSMAMINRKLKLSFPFLIDYNPSS